MRAWLSENSTASRKADFRVDFLDPPNDEDTLETSVLPVSIKIASIHIPALPRSELCAVISTLEECGAICVTNAKVPLRGTTTSRKLKRLTRTMHGDASDTFLLRNSDSLWSSGTQQ